MSKFQSYKIITDRLKALGNKLSNEKLSADELNEFEVLAHQLYERALILNYKAKEERVHNSSSKIESAEKNDDKHEEPSATKPIVEEKKEAQEESNSDAGEIQFDFSSDEEPEKEVPSEPTEAAVEVDDNNEASASVKTEDKVEEVAKEDIPSSSSINDAFDDEKTQSFYERFQKVHNESIGDRLGASKLNSLKGAIGLNDKMQYIAELFEGDSDKFNKTLEALDQQPSNQDARKTLSQVAAKQSWDEENPLVEEFARLIERRYVEE